MPSTTMELVNSITMAILCGQIGIVTHCGRLVLLLCLPSENVHRELRALSQRVERTHGKTARSEEANTHQVSLSPGHNSGQELSKFFQLLLLLHTSFSTHAWSTTVYIVVCPQHGPSLVSSTFSISHMLRNRLPISIINFLT